MSAKSAPRPGRALFEQSLKERSGRLAFAIHDLWQARDGATWSRDPYYCIRLGRLAETLGQSLFALDILGEGMRHFPRHVRLTQMYCGQLVTCGFLREARNLLDALVKRGSPDAQTVSLLGRVYKEMWLIEGNDAADHPHLARSRNLYEAAYRRGRGSAAGISAATLSMVAGDRAGAHRLAGQVIRSCLETWKDPSRRDYGTLATIAEAFLLLGRQDKAAKYYTLARARSDSSDSLLAGSRRELLLLSRHLPVETRVLDAMRAAPVVAFAGHRIDAPGQKRRHFTPPEAAAVKKQIADVLDRLDVRIGYASAACGGDVLFHECLLERGAQSNVVLPFGREQFFRTSVAVGGREWVKRARLVLSRSTAVEEATRGDYGGEDQLFTYANSLILGKAILRSRSLSTEPLLLAVWDRTRDGAPGGVAECVALWEQTGFRSLLIHPGTAALSERPARRAAGKPLRARPRRTKTPARQITCMLFADMVGYAALKEEQVPVYVLDFLGSLTESLVRTGHSPAYANTWGDALCFVFADPVAAAECALAMRDTVRDTDWSERGLPTDFGLRIGLHAGPVYRLTEPLLDRVNFFGFHMNQAARIEPALPPGNVYASEAFASLLLADSRNTLECRAVGVIALPRDSRSYPLYHIRRKAELG